MHLSRCLETIGYPTVLQGRDVDRIVPLFSSLLSEGLPETRAAAKQMASNLLRESRRAGEDERIERLLQV